jgi:hypothetical protein
MKVFISWSGKLSEEVASLLKRWLPYAVPGTDTFLSKEDIDKGAIWFGDIEAVLKDTSVGVICLTRENKARPWILFEAGGLNKGLNKSRVCPLLLDLDAKELDLPLKAFNAATPDRENMWALCKTINRQNAEKTFPEPHLEEFFNKFWPDFDSKFTALLKKHGGATPPKQKGVQEIVEQILETVQALLTASQTSPVIVRPALASPGGPSYPPFIPQIPSGELSKEQQNILEYARLFGPDFYSSVKPPEPKLSPGEKPPSKPPAA